MTSAAALLTVVCVALPAAGEALFARECAVCHGLAGAAGQPWRCRGSAALATGQR
jgi:mono/diheme cytochrome c family protein